MPERTTAAHLVQPPAWVWSLPLAERLEFYRTQMPAAQYRDYLDGVNAAANPKDGARQGRLA
jgi:hypothetical protein